jgi:hypothetical protein
MEPRDKSCVLLGINQLPYKLSYSQELASANRSYSYVEGISRLRCQELPLHALSHSVKQLLLF